MSKDADDDIISFDDDEVQKQGPTSKIVMSTVMKAQRQPSDYSDVVPDAKEIDTKEGPIINFSRLIKTTKDTLKSSLKVEPTIKKKRRSPRQSPKESPQPSPNQEKQSMFLSQKEDAEPAIIKLEDPEEQAPQQESDIFVLQPKKSPSIVPDEIFDKFNKSMDSSSYNPQKKNIGGTTEPFPMSDENRQDNIETIFSQHLIIGMQATDAKNDYYGVSPFTQSNPLWLHAMTLAVKRQVKNPVLPFLLLCVILDSTITSNSQWYFITTYVLILAIVPTYFWYIIYKTELALEYKFDKQTVLVWDYNLKRFTNRMVNRLFPGSVIMLKKGDRVPGPIVVLQADGGEMAFFEGGLNIRCLAQKLSDSELAYLDGRIEFNELPLFNNNTRARLRLDLIDPIDTQITSQDRVEENSIVESPEVVGILLQASVKQKYHKESLSFNLPLYLNPLQSEYFTIALAIILAVTLSIAALIWQQSNQSKHLYILSSNYGFLQSLIDHLVLYSAIIPTFLEVIRPIFLFIAYTKISNDASMDPERSGKLSQIHSYHAIDNLAATKFVNYSNCLDQSVTRVQSSFLLTGPPINDEEIRIAFPRKEDPYDLKPKDQEAINMDNKQKYETVEIGPDALYDDKSRQTYVFERVLLGLPQGVLDEQQLAIQKYCQLADCVQFSYTTDNRSLLLPKDVLRIYDLKLIVQTGDFDAYLYQVPCREEESEDEDAEPEEATDLQQLQERIKKDRELFEEMHSKKYIWAVQADVETSYLCKDFNSLQRFTTGKAFFEAEINNDQFNKLYKTIGRTNFRKKYVKLPQFEMEVLMSSLKPVAVFQFEKQIKDNFHLMLDLNLATIRQWIFVSEEKPEQQDTMAYLNQFMERIEFTKDDLLNKITNMKQQAIPIYKQSLDKFKIQDNLYKIDDRYIILVVNSEVIDAANSEGECKTLFLECLMIASFVVFQNLTRAQIDQVITFQKEQAKQQTVVTVANKDEDLLLCRTNTIRCCTETSAGMFNQLAHFQLLNPDGLSKLILIHARTTHMRTAGFFLFQLYKGFLITMCEFFFSFFNGYSSSQLFTPGFHFMFQIFFTSVYGLLIFVFYSDVNHKLIRMFAGQFVKCQRGEHFTRKQIVMAFVDSCYQGFIIFYLPANILQYANNDQGIIEGFYYISLVSFLTVNLTSIFQPVMYFSTFSKEQVLSLVFTVAGVIATLFLTCASDQLSTNIPQYIFHIYAVLNSIKSIFIIIFISCICLTPSIIMQQYIVVSDSQLVTMIHYYDEIEDEEEEKKLKEEMKEKKEEQEEEDQPIKKQKVNESHLESSQMDIHNMSQAELVEK